MKLCVNCVHYDKVAVLRGMDGITFHENRCTVFNFVKSPVDGSEIQYMECSAMRLGPCGMDGKMYRSNGFMITCCQCGSKVDIYEAVGDKPPYTCQACTLPEASKT